MAINKITIKDKGIVAVSLGVQGPAGPTGPQGPAGNISIATTDSLAEGVTNLYFTNNRAVSALTSTLSNYVPTNRTVNGVALTSNVTLTTANIADSTDKRYITDAKSTVLNQTSGTNTGDQDLSGLVPKTTTINGVNLSSNVSLTTANINDSTNKRYITDAQQTVLTNTSGTNTGDNAVNSLYSGLVSNANHTGDATGSTVLTLATVNNNTGSFGNATTVPAFTVNGKGLITAASNNTIPTANSSTTGLLTSIDWATFNGKQAALVSGTNIKTINNVTLLGSGDLSLGGGVASVSATSPLSSTGGSTPNISIALANTTTDGYLSSTDWNTFNNKGSGTVTAVTATSPLSSTGGTTPNISIPQANGTTNGYLTSTDWTTFNNKGTGTVTNVTGTGSVDGITLSGTVTGAGNLTLSGAITTIPNLTGVITSNSTVTSLGSFTSSQLATALTDETGSGSAVFATNCTLVTPALGTPQSGNLSNCDGNATSLIAGKATILETTRTIDGVSFNGSANITVIADGTHAATSKTTPVDNDELPLVDSAASNVLKKLTWSNLKATLKTYFDTLYPPSNGWISLGALTYETADSPTFQFSIASDATGYIGVGMRIKLTQTTDKFFIVTAVGAYSGGKTIITVYGGTDYTLANASITSPYYSNIKAPFGFPLNPDKWSVKSTLTSRQTQASPTTNTWYNLGSSYSMPIGNWDVVVTSLSWYVAVASGGANGDFQLCLSTSSSSASDTELMAGMGQNVGNSSHILLSTVMIRKTIAVSSKTTQYLNMRTTNGAASLVIAGDVIPTVILFRCAYL